MTHQFDFWQDHSRRFLTAALSPDRTYRMENPDGYGKRTGSCGDTVEIFLHMENGRIHSASFNTNGCINTSACAFTVCEMAEGLDPEKAWAIDAGRVEKALETLPPDHFHCAELATGALYLALARLEETRKNPWKKAYLKKNG